MPSFCFPCWFLFSDLHTYYLTCNLFCPVLLHLFSLHFDDLFAFALVFFLFLFLCWCVHTNTVLTNIILDFRFKFLFLFSVVFFFLRLIKSLILFSFAYMYACMCMCLCDYTAAISAKPIGNLYSFASKWFRVDYFCYCCVVKIFS